MSKITIETKSGASFEIAIDDAREVYEQLARLYKNPHIKMERFRVSDDVQVTHVIPHAQPFTFEPAPTPFPVITCKTTE